MKHSEEKEFKQNQEKIYKQKRPVSNASGFSTQNQPNQVSKSQTNHDKQTKKIVRLNEATEFVVDPEYTIMNVIGNGGYGMVASGENIVTKQKVAIKKVPDLFADERFEVAKRQLREIKILRFLKHKHKNIVNLLDIMRIEDKNTFNQIYLVMELMQFNLKQLIESKRQITEPMRKFILYQLLDGVQYMHSADIIHRDLKPQNILLNNKCDIKITDMNLAKKETLYNNNTLYVTTRPYRAFQVLLSVQNYTKSIDIWSIGCIFAQLIGRTVLFEGRGDIVDQLRRLVAIMGKPELQLISDIALDNLNRKTLTQIIREMPDRNKIKWDTLFPNIDPIALDLLDNMLVYDPTKRFTAEKCLNHPYLKDIRSKSRLIKCENVFDFSFDSIEPEQNSVRQAIFQEAQAIKKMQNALGKNRDSGQMQKRVEGKARKMKKVQ